MKKKSIVSFVWAAPGVLYFTSNPDRDNEISWIAIFRGDHEIEETLPVVG
jgi:hypothetical protein